jgi:hypothetical protein
MHVSGREGQRYFAAKMSRLNGCGKRRERGVDRKKHPAGAEADVILFA